MKKKKNPLRKIKIDNPLRGLTWKAIPAVTLLAIYMGVGIVQISATRFADGIVFLMFGVGMYWYTKKVQSDNLGIWFEFEDLEEEK